MNLAPIILFVYNRPWHTQQTLEALMLNDLADQSTLYIYCDGPKNKGDENEISKIQEVKNIIKKKKWCKEIIIIERFTNVGLAANIIEGVTEVINRHGSVIVLEDDILTSKGFLNYMNDALTLYEDNKDVMHISGFMYPHKEKLPETFFFNVPLCWGWATWKDSWKYFNNDSISQWKKLNIEEAFIKFDKFGGDYLSSQLAHNISGRLNTWFIKWHASVFLKKGYTLYPNLSLVDNIGFDNTGVHNGLQPLFKNASLAKSISVKEIDLLENENASRIIKSFYDTLRSKKDKLKLSSFIKRNTKKIIRNIIFKFIPELKRHKYNDEIVKKKSYLGHNCKIYPRARLTNTIIGSYTYIAENAIINNTVIGKFCSIGPNLFCGWGIHPSNGISTHPMFYSIRKQNGITVSTENKIDEILQIKIGNDVFIGTNVTILDGITIGNGAIIGAGAVVSKDIPPYAIAVGNPIRIIKYRFDDITVGKLIKIKWWDHDYQELYLVEKYFFDVQKYLATIEVEVQNEKQ
jgi:acetyltransferase-like isoleucine patch superfamily enzyme